MFNPPWGVVLESWLKWKVGELTIDLDILREAARRPTTPGTSDE
jgi:hypothetical protein